MKPTVVVVSYINIIIFIVFGPKCMAQTYPNSYAESIKLKSNFEKGSFGIIFFRHDTLTVGIESRTRFSTGTLNDTTCKITAFDEMIFACTGVLGHDDFNIVSFAQGVLKMDIGTKSKIQLFESTIQEKMNVWLNTPYWKHACQYEGINLSDFSINSVFCTYINNNPTIYNRIFYPYCDGANIVVDTFFYDYSLKSIQCFPFGYNYEDAKTYIKSLDSSFFLSNRPEAIIVSLIEHHSAENKNFVGGAIDIVQLTRNGKAKWVYKKTNCGN